MANITKICVFEGCGGTLQVRKSYCNKHYNRLLKYGDPSIVFSQHERHGLHGTPEYLVWINIRRRCYNPNHKSYSDYGGRGIRLCTNWYASFLSFYKYIGKRPSKQHSLDRIDNDGNYEPGNVRWATAKEQANNMRSNHRITIGGRTQTLTQWSMERQISPWAVSKRLSAGWSVERTFELD